MTVNGVITVYRKDNETGIRTDICTDIDAMIQYTDAEAIRKYGAEKTGTARIFIPAADIGVRVGNYIEFDGVSGRVMTCAVHRYGSPPMHHTEVTVK